MRVPFYDPRGEYISQKKAIDRAIGEVLDSGHYALGPRVRDFEKDLAAYCGVRHAIGVSSGTAALQLALVASGIGDGDEVITAPNSDISTAAAISHCGARVVFADIQQDSLTIDPNQVESRITSRTKALVPVHLFGQPAAMAELQDVATRHDLIVVEDAALALGAKFRGLQPGSLGDAGCLSMNSRKILSAFGDAGAVITNRDDIAETVASLRDYGKDRRPDFEGPSVGPGHASFSRIGFNARLDELQAAVLGIKMTRLEPSLARRREIAATYDDAFRRLPISFPQTHEETAHAYRAYTIVTEHSAVRARLIEYLAAKDIDSAVYYAPPLHLQPALASLGHRKGDFPVAEAVGETMLSLPIHPTMSEGMTRHVVRVVKEFFDG